MSLRVVIVMEMLVLVTKVAVKSFIVTEMVYSVTIQVFRRVIVTEMLNIVTNAALEMSIVMEMRYSVTVELLGVCYREEITLPSITE